MRVDRQKYKKSRLQLQTAFFYGFIFQNNSFHGYQRTLLVYRRAPYRRFAKNIDTKQHVVNFSIVCWYLFFIVSFLNLNMAKKAFWNGWFHVSCQKALKILLKQ